MLCLVPLVGTIIKLQKDNKTTQNLVAIDLCLLIFPQAVNPNLDLVVISCLSPESR